MLKSQIVYIREAKLDELPDQFRGSDKKIFALHDGESGEQLALSADREIAFALARRNDLTPKSVH
ncbi:MAG: DUF1150 family protein [Pseudomonadota bacterium]